jgi:protein-tyrosine-phosphatase
MRDHDNGKPYNVLFLCTGNSARSIMAEAILNRAGRENFRSFSAGSHPKGRVHPYAIDLLTKLHYDVTGLRSKSWKEFSGPAAPKLDFVFTVCDSAAKESCPLWPGQPMNSALGRTRSGGRNRYRGGSALRICRHAAHAHKPYQHLHQPAAVLAQSADVAKATRRDRQDQGCRRQARFGRLMIKTSISLSRRLLAEGLGTAILVATVVGSGIMAERLAGGNQAIALLGNTLPTGAILVVIITIFGPVSGAHFNPAVTLVFATRGEILWAEVLPYVVVQCAGGIAGTVAAHFMFDLAPIVIGIKGRTGPGAGVILGLENPSLALRNGLPMARGSYRHVHPRSGDPRRAAIRAFCRSLACRLDDHGGLLVHGIHVFCQSSGHARARLYQHLRRDCAR